MDPSTCTSFVCEANACVPRTNTCDDGLDCTGPSTCDGANGCTTPTIDAGFCVIDNACVPEGINPANPCQECDPSVSQTEWTNVAAGTICGDDFCDPNDNNVLIHAPTCNGNGSCGHSFGEETTSCGEYICSESENACLTECETDADCA